MIEIVNMVLVDMQFRCELCGQHVMKKIRLMNDLRFDINDAPEGWVITAGDGYFRVYCPDHASRK